MVQLDVRNDEDSTRIATPVDFSGLVEQMRSATRGPDDSVSLARAGHILTSAFADPSRSAAILSSWADEIEQGAEPDRGRSQMHNNGFSKISLVRLDGGWNLRLHVWPAGQGDQRIHDHRWSFASIAVDGALDVMNYTRDDDALAAGAPRYRLFDATGTGEKRLERVEDGRIRPTSSYRISSGAFHILDYRDPHIVWNNTGADAVTLMLSGPAKREYSHSYGERTAADVLPAPDVIDDDRAIAHVRAIAARLRGVAQ
ncbi:hypothetical protein [Microbacterium allomyrinae]|uniref:Cysteine dioxygenase n=1 Tax=Microbacterium allomyrinae TaxID=2830666 RepID=A0A9X1LW61_9MICO|nr:hypothetical protein [Microbacterium allomyrinae]MCC2033214.1 hypothetical protein [Microbacterium allomyrinae]